MRLSLNFKYFIRRPFMVRGVEVDKDNIDEVAEWCDGAVVDDPGDDEHEPRLFIRVPVEGARSVMQTEAHLGYWVIRSKNRGKHTYKVYRKVSLLREFVEVTDFGSDDEDTMELRTTETDEEPDREDNRILANVRKLPGARFMPTPATVTFNKRTV